MDNNTLKLDARQRAMLRAMGVVVWQPKPAGADTIAVPAQHSAPEKPLPPKKQAPPPPERPPAAHTATAHTTPAIWHMQAAQAIYPAALDTTPSSGGWLILLQRPASALPPDAAHAPGAAHTALQGQAAQLLDNMLRALHLHRHPRVFSAACTPANAADEPGHAAGTLPASLQTLLAERHPACILVLGMALARAVLQQPHASLGQLRAQVHKIGQVPVIVSHDPAYLLRAQATAKAAAWADLCRARAFFDGRKV